MTAPLQSTGRYPDPSGAPAQVVALAPKDDPFYSYSGSTHADGDLEWTPGDKPGIGAGDGVMIAGDVRTLARAYCARGTKVHYEQYDALSHITSIATWLRNAIVWIKQRFTGLPAVQNCLSIAPGNRLDSIPEPSPAGDPADCVAELDGRPTT